MFYLKYLTALVAYIVVALKAAPLTRTLQHATGQLLEWFEVIFEIPPQYMVIGELIDMEGKLTFLLFCLILFSLLRFSLLALMAGLRKLKPAKKAAS